MNAGFCFLEIILKHSSHAVEFQGLIRVHIAFQFFLCLPLTFLLDLLIKPLLLFILKKLFAGVIL
jgi:hypothetical protein